MSYDRSFQRSVAGAQAVGSSISWLDGVPFQIGPKFKAPPKVDLPIDLGRQPPSLLLSEEYFFDVEEGVLQWAEERERQQDAQRTADARKREAQIQAESERVAHSIEQFSSSDDSAEDEKPDGLEAEFSNPFLHSSRPHATASITPNIWQNTPSSANPHATSSITPNIWQNTPSSANVWPNMLLANISSDILTPTQCKSNEVEKTEDKKTSELIDVKLFEKVDDPFDNLELQTLNDYEELKHVLEGSQNGPPAVSSHSGDTSCGFVRGTDSAVTTTAGNAETETTMVSAIWMNTNNSNEAIHFGCVPSQNNGNGDDGDYIHLRQDDFFQGGGKDRSVSPDNGFRLPQLPIGGANLTGRTPLPPIGSDYVNVEVNRFQNSCDLVIDGDLRQSEGSSRQPSANRLPDYENFTLPSYEEVTLDSDKYAVSFKSPYSRHSTSPEPNYLNYKPKANGFPSTDILNSSLRNTRSTPDIVSSVEETETRGNVFPVSRSPPPRPSVQQDLSLTEVKELWNPYTPLPPAPVPSHNSVVSPASSGKSTSSDDIAGELDPYIRLTKESQAAVDKVISMGFSRPRVARAVERLGLDEKEVVEHLCLVDKFTEQGYDGRLSETALLLFDNSFKKAQSYMDLHSQFQELGFTGDRIREALVSSKLDRDKALDLLTT